MKNKKKLLAALAAAAVMAVGGGVLGGCGGGHEHTYSNDWKSDETNHWHVATCDDLKEGDKDYKSGVAAHQYGDDNECDVCGYKKAAPDPDPDPEEHTITVDANGGTLTSAAELTTVDGKLANLPSDPTPPANKKFDGWYTEAEGGTEVTTSTEFTGNDTIYAHYSAKTPDPVDPYTITLHVGAGTLEAGALTEYKTTAEGLIDLKGEDYLPEPTSSTEHWHFLNWYDAETGGNPVDEATHVFTEDTDLYAVYVRDNGVWNNDGSAYIAGLTRNTGEQTGTQYWLGGSDKKIELEKDDVITLYMDGELVTFNVHATFASSCIENASDTSTKVTSVTVSEDAEFAIYLWDYSTAQSANWSCQFFGIANSIETTSTIPTGCEQVKITDNNGTATLYVVINGTAVNSDNAENYYIHGWQASLNNIFGTWGSTPSLAGDENGEIVVDATLDKDLTLMFYWDGGQSGNVSNVKVGGTYIVKIKGDNVSVKAYDPDGPAEEEEDPDDTTFVKGGYYVVGNMNSYSLNAAYYINPEGGSPIEFAKNAKIQVSSTQDGETAAWDCKDSTQFVVTGGAAYIDFKDGSEGTVVTAGEYTVTVDTTGEKPVFTFTPAEGLEPDTSVNYYPGYLVGKSFSYMDGETEVAVDNNGIWVLNDKLNISENGLTVIVTSSTRFQIVPDIGGPDPGWNTYTADNNFVIKEGTEGSFTVSGNDVSLTAGTYKITQENKDGKSTFYFEAVVPEEE